MRVSIELRATIPYPNGGFRKVGIELNDIPIGKTLIEEKEIGEGQKEISYSWKLDDEEFESAVNTGFDKIKEILKKTLKTK